MALNIDGLACNVPADRAPRRKSRSVDPTKTSWTGRGFASALDQIGLVSITDALGRILHVNDAFIRLSGYARHELLGRTHEILSSSYHSPAFWADAYRTLGAQKPWRAQVLNKAKSGKLYWVDALIVPLWSRNEPKGFLSVQRDLTEMTALRAELDERVSILNAVIEHFPGSVAAFDGNHKLVLANRRQREILNNLGCLHQTAEQFYRANAVNGDYGSGDVEAHVHEYLDIAARGKSHVVERQRPDGSYVEIRHIPLAAGGFVAAQVDIADRKRDQDMIERPGESDALMELPDRGQFLNRLREALEDGRNGLMAVHCINVDALDLVNESVARQARDALLKQSAQRLRRHLGNDHTIGRLGDNFAILQSEPKSIDDIEVMAKRIISELSISISINGRDISPEPNIGIAIAPADGSDAEQLVRNADSALWRTKSAAPGTYGFFEAAVHERLNQRLRMAAELREALANNEFELHYQPIMNIKTKKPVSCEALIRWVHPEHGLVPASEFIPIAEECGLIGQIGDWVLKTACAEAGRWPDNVAIAVNISAAQFNGPSLVDKVIAASKGLPLSRLILEITETLLMKDRDAAANMLSRLKKLGVRFAIDDFGTGFSSLSYLQSFPFDKIKIDRSFVSNTANQKRSATLRRSIIQLGYNLGMSSVAEGVETEQQLDMLRAEGCVEAQGFLFSPAVPASRIRQLFSASQ